MTRPNLVPAAALAALMLPMAALAQTAPAQTAPATAPAAAPAASPVMVMDAYARSTNPKAAAVFMTLHNMGSNACTLTGARTALTDRAELHTHVEKDGVMKMTKVDSILLPAGDEHKMQMGGDHVMLMALKTPLKQADPVSLTLDLGECGQVEVTATVDNSRGMPAGMPGMKGAPGAMTHDHKMPAKP